MAASDLWRSFRRILPFIGYHHLLMMLHATVIILCSILLAGCSSYSSMTNIYIVEMSYINSTLSNLTPLAKNLSETISNLKGPAQLDVRAGYFGMCVRQRGVVWLCSSDATGLAEQIGSDGDPLNLIGAVSKFRGDVIFSGLLFMAVVLAFLSFLLLSTFPGWHDDHADDDSSIEAKPFPSIPVSKAALSQAFVSAVLLLIAAVWQHIGAIGAAAMIESATYGNVKTTLGATGMAFAWTAFALETVVAIGVLTVILAVQVLAHLRA